MRTVRLEHSAQPELDRLVRQHHRFDEVYRAMEWLLANDPESQGVARNGHRVCFHFSGWADMPGIVVVYTHTDQLVVIYGIQAIENPRDRPA